MAAKPKRVEKAEPKKVWRADPAQSRAGVDVSCPGPPRAADCVPSVMAERDRLSDLVKRAHELVEQLTEAAHPVLGPAREPVLDKLNMGGAPCQLAADLREIAFQLDGVNDVLEDLIGRLEV